MKKTVVVFIIALFCALSHLAKALPPCEWEEDEYFLPQFQFLDDSSDEGESPSYEFDNELEYLYTPGDQSFYNAWRKNAEANPPRLVIANTGDR